MNKRIVQIDEYDIVELHAGGEIVMTLKWNKEGRFIDTIISGSMSLKKPGIVEELEKEGILNE